MTNQRDILLVATPAESEPGHDLKALDYPILPKSHSASKSEFPELPNGSTRRKRQHPYRYVQAFIDNWGEPRLYFRRVGRPRISLPGLIGSPVFETAYTAAFNEAPLPPPASSLPGGVIARCGQRPNTVQPLIGVYLLMLKGQIVYIGEQRVAAHRANGRPFDQVFYIATPAKQRVALERVRIKAINPLQNRRGCAAVLAELGPTSEGSGA